MLHTTTNPTLGPVTTPPHLGGGREGVRHFITKTELAQAYFPYIDPRAARHKLMQLINDETMLYNNLVECGYKSDNRHFTPKQVEMITEWLGNPWK